MVANDTYAQTSPWPRSKVLKVEHSDPDSWDHSVDIYIKVDHVQQEEVKLVGKTNFKVVGTFIESQDDHSKLSQELIQEFSWTTDEKVFFWDVQTSRARMDQAKGGFHLQVLIVA